MRKICFYVLYAYLQLTRHILLELTDKQIFEKLDQDITKYSVLGDIILMGDLNAHINRNDFDLITDELIDNLDDFLPTNYIADVVHKYRNTEIPQITNSYGKQIIELCTEAQLRIWNGRTLGDSKWKITFINHNGTSINDYCICSSEFLQNSVNFTAGPFEPTISDHRPITVNILSQFLKKPTEYLKTPLKKLMWSRAREEHFKSNIMNFDFHSIFNELEELNNSSVFNNALNSESFRNSIDNTVNKLSSVLYNSACMGPRDQNSSSKRRPKQGKIKKNIL